MTENKEMYCSPSVIVSKKMVLNKLVNIIVMVVFNIINLMKTILIK